MRSTVACFVLIVLSGCATTPPPTPAVSDPVAWLRGGREGLRIWAERTTEEFRNEDVVVYGNGVAIWNNRFAFRLADPEVEQILEAFEELSFEQIPEMSPRGKRLRRRAGIRTTSYAREALQTWEAPENEELKRLVDRIFEVVGPPTERTVSSAESLNDGLTKVSRGELPAEALSLVVHKKPARGDGFLLRVEHGAATSVRYVDQRLTNPVEINPSDTAIRDLASRLATFQPESLPINLYASDYTEVIVRVLNHDKSILARSFADLTPTRHGEDQARFDRMVTQIEQIRAIWF